MEQQQSRGGVTPLAHSGGGSAGGGALHASTLHASGGGGNMLFASDLLGQGAQADQLAQQGVDVHAYLERKYRERRRAELAHQREKDERQRRKLQAYQEPKKDLSDAYLITVGKKKVDLNDPRQHINKEIFDQLPLEEQQIYEKAHSKTHVVNLGGKKVDLKDKSQVISRVQYDQLSRNDKQIYLISHPRDPGKADEALRMTPRLMEYLDQKYGATGKSGAEKLRTSAFKWT